MQELGSPCYTDVRQHHSASTPSSTGQYEGPGPGKHLHVALNNFHRNSHSSLVLSHHEHQAVEAPMNILITSEVPCDFRACRSYAWEKAVSSGGQAHQKLAIAPKGSSHMPAPAA